MPETAFTAAYWDSVYAEPQTMDGIFNASLHTDYLQALFSLDGVKVRSVLDVGFGLGHLFNAVIQRFRPARAVGIEPSVHAFDVARSVIRPPKGCRLKLLCMTVEEWCARPRRPASFDLTLCTSVLQYLDDDTLARVLPVLAARTRFVYLTVPTDVEARRMLADYNFADAYARHRTRSEYRAHIDPHFTIIGNRLLESRAFYDETSRVFVYRSPPRAHPLDTPQGPTVGSTGTYHFM